MGEGEGAGQGEDTAAVEEVALLVVHGGAFFLESRWLPGCVRRGQGSSVAETALAQRSATDLMDPGLDLSGLRALFGAHPRAAELQDQAARSTGEGRRRVQKPRFPPARKMADGQSAADAAMMAGPGAAAAAAIADAPAVGTDGAAAAAAPPPGIQLKANMGVSTNTKWTYKDDAGVDQGPYSTLQLNQWYLAGYMKSDRMVKKVKASIKFFEAGGGGEKEEEIALGDVPELVSAARPPTAQEQQEMLRAQLLAQQSMLYKQGLGAPTVTDVVNKIFELPEGCEGMLLGSVKNWNDSKGFGFIIPGATGEHIFVHREDIRNAPKNGSLVRGMNVLYNKVATPTGQDRATDVCMADGTDIEPGQGGGGRYETCSLLLATFLEVRLAGLIRNTLLSQVRR